MSVIEGRLGKMWALSGRKLETWLPRKDVEKDEVLNEFFA